MTFGDRSSALPLMLLTRESTAATSCRTRFLSSPPSRSTLYT